MLVSITSVHEDWPRHSFPRSWYLIEYKKDLDSYRFLEETLGKLLLGSRSPWHSLSW